MASKENLKTRLNYPFTSFLAPSIICGTTRSNCITSLIVDMIPWHNLPIRLVEMEGFRQLMLFHEHRYKVPSHNRITAKMKVIMFAQKKEALSDEMKEVKSVALTTDCWMARNQEGYMMVMAHFIKE